MARFRVDVSDYGYPDLAVERRILEPAGAEVIGLACRTGEGLAEQAAAADAILQEYAKIPRANIERLKRCKAICRYTSGWTSSLWPRRPSTASLSPTSQP